MKKILFKSDYDAFQFVSLFIVGIAFLYFKVNIATIVILIILIIGGWYSAFGRGAVFYEDHIVAYNFFVKKVVQYEDIKYSETVRPAQGKRRFILYLKNKKIIRGYCNDARIDGLEKLLKKKNIKMKHRI